MMATGKMEKLIQILEAGRQSAAVLGGKVVVTPFGGRILGLFPGSGKNLLWVNEQFLSDPAAFFMQDDWRNIGGDRTWIAPELETNGNPNLPGYEVQRTMDPGSYKVVSSSGGEVVMEGTPIPHFKTLNIDAPLKLTKTVRLLTAPPVPAGRGVACAGYEQMISLTAAEPLSAGVKPGAWNILQVPVGGEIHVPVKRKTAPRAFIGKPVFQCLTNEVVSTVKAKDSFKFCIHADDSRGMIFYLNTNDPDQATLLMRTFCIGPAACYSDVPGDDPTASGYMTQIYVAGAASGGFGEMEYHAPCLCAERTSVKDVSQVWGFIGPADAIVKLMDELKQQ